MAITKIQSESMNLADTYAFTGTVTGAGGVTEIDMWRLNANVSGSGSSSFAKVTSSWERADSDGFGVKGTGLTESSGVFTFPSTGYWKIDVGMTCTSSNDQYFRIRLMYGGTSGDNSFVAEGYESSGAGSYMQTGFSCIIKNTDTSADKFSFYNSISSGSIKGDTGGNSSGFVCTKIAEI
tara:strand:+ start:522 stop:1061 length:540 start_codon:yes stop_codon:yes gene_type:complete